MHPGTIEILASVLFGFAVLHTFLSSRFQHIARTFPEGSIGENFFHLLGEVEVVFGLWAGILLIGIALIAGTTATIQYTETLHFTEPLFVFAIMAAAATRPVIEFATKVVLIIGRLIPLPREMAVYLATLSLGPLLGSFITEPAAMTVTALILRNRYYAQPSSEKFKYLTLGVLFVNISIGGVLTPYAAPPVLMVAGKWNWDLWFMLQAFGWKALIATLLNAAGVTFFLRRELGLMKPTGESGTRARIPAWLTAIHLIVLAMIVLNAHHPVIFLGIFMFFLGLTAITREFQEDLKIRESLLVAFFLGGLVVLGGLQAWWLEPLLRSLNALPLFVGATALTTITDNAALTYLGSQVPGISETFKYALVAGAVAGGGMTVIANAPNPAGYTILQDRFGPDGISPAKLALAAVSPTLVAMGCLWLLS